MHPVPCTNTDHDVTDLVNQRRIDIWETAFKNYGQFIKTFNKLRCTISNLTYVNFKLNYFFFFL